MWVSRFYRIYLKLTSGVSFQEAWVFAFWIRRGVLYPPPRQGAPPSPVPGPARLSSGPPLPRIPGPLLSPLETFQECPLPGGTQDV